MAIVGGLDVHRRQITFDYVDLVSGEGRRGQIRPATREKLREWLEGLDHDGEVAFAVEATTGWRFVVEELVRVGMTALLAEPAETRTLRGRKQRAKTDRADAQHLRELVAAGRVPESWVPPGHLLELRTLVRLRKSLLDERRVWQQRIHAYLFHHGLPGPSNLLANKRRAWLETLDVPVATRAGIDVALRVADQLTTELRGLDRQLSVFARRQPACRVLMRRFGIGPVVSTAILAELGDTRRFSSSRKAVRYAGLDVTVWDSDRKRAPGHLSRQGPPLLRWALFEAAKSAFYATSPDHGYYLEAKARVGGKRATLAVARRLCRWAHHTLRSLGDDALAPAA